jgi:hypothetical protein
MYLSYAVFCEGASDREYLNGLIPRVITKLVLDEGTRLVEVAPTPAVTFNVRGTVEEVAQAACKASNSFHLFFIHADTGGRAQERNLPNRSEAYCEAMQQECNWPRERCIVVAPRHETEAWVMMDHEAVAKALGYRGDLSACGMPRTPAECEALADPKATLNSVIKEIRGRRARRENATDLYPAIAGRQEIAVLRGSASFLTFEEEVRVSLRSVGCLPQLQ